MNYLNLIKFNKLKAVMLVFLFLVIAVASITAITGKVFYENISASAPAGIYMVTVNQNLQYNDYAVVALPVDVPCLNAKQGYPMLKKVQGLPGDSYTVSKEGTYREGRLYKSFSLDNIPSVLDGEYIVPEDYILFLNDPDISFDSRYLGPIHQSYVIKKVILLVPYEPFYKIMKVL